MWCYVVWSCCRDIKIKLKRGNFTNDFIKREVFVGVSVCWKIKAVFRHLITCWASKHFKFDSKKKHEITWKMMVFCVKTCDDMGEKVSWNEGFSSVINPIFHWFWYGNLYFFVVFRLSDGYEASCFFYLMIWWTVKKWWIIFTRKQQFLSLFISGFMLFFNRIRME